MSFKLRKWLVLFLTLVCVLFEFHASKAQQIKKPVKIITTKDGLPQSFISGLIQDRDGFVWVGTRNGLARFDGIHFKVFLHHYKDSATISSNVIISLAKDSRKQIWIEHESGQIDLINPRTELVERVTDRSLFRKAPVKFVRRGWLADQLGNLWLVQKAGGVHKYDWSKKTITYFSQQKKDFSSDTIRGLLEDRLHQVWILSQRGISRYDSLTQKFKNVNIPFGLDFNNYIDSEAEIISLHERKNGEIMFGDRKNLIFYNPSKNAFRKIPLPINPQKGIRWIQTGPDGKEYIETAGNVYLYDDSHRLVQVAEAGKSISTDTPAFLVDQSGLIWLGTNAAGIHQIDLGTPFFESSPNVHSFHQDLLQQEFNISLAQFAGWPVTSNDFLGSSYFVRSTYDPSGRLWLALRDRIGYYDLASGHFVKLPNVPGMASNTNLSLGIRGIEFTPNGGLYAIGHDGFIGYFDQITKKWQTFLDASVLKKKTGPELTLLDISVDKDYLLLTTGSGNGLISVNIKTKQIRIIDQKKYPDRLPTNLLLGMQHDPSRPHLLWIGSYNGLILLNKRTLKTQVFSTEDGLPDNTIYSILTDKGGYLWLSTNKGICRFDPLSHHVQTFLSDDGMPGDEFNRFHHLKLPNGRLAFGGTEGWTIFDPTNMKVDTYHPQVAFTNLKINNINAEQHIEPGLLPSPLNDLKDLTLPYDHNSLTFEFAGLEFNRPKKLKYRYLLENYDNDWIEAGNSPIASYTKLPPGNYKLKINSSNSTGQWSPNVRELTLIILPPFWLSWWAYSLYVLLAAGLVWLYMRYLRNRERLRQEIILKEKESVQLKELDALKTRFFSNITHEFRTPLTLILTPVQRLKPTLNGAEQNRWIAAIERNTHQLLRLINQLLDLTKLESGTLKINEGVGNPGKFIEDLIASFVPEAEGNGVKLAFKMGTVIGEYRFDPDKLEQIVSNLVANAIKFTPSGGGIEVSISEKIHSTTPARDYTAGSNEVDYAQNGIVIEVRDTGLGILPDKLPHIFDRFYQVEDPTHTKLNAPGSGIGLSLVKEMVDLQHGTIKVTSSNDDSSPWKTSFLVWLPYQQSTSTEEPLKENTFRSVPTFENHSTRTLAETNVVTADEDSPSILLVEDNLELAEFIADSLPEGYRITTAVNGADGLEKAIKIIPDLIISDVLMPVMDGFEFCKKTKNDDQTSHIPVILLTAKASFSDRIEGLSIGADDYLTKPFHIQELQLRVSNLLERQRLMREKLRAEMSTPERNPPETDEHTVTTLQDIFVQKIYGIVEEKLGDTSFGVEELSGEIGMSRASLHRKVKTLTGMPPGDIIRNYRLKRAAHFLKQGYNSSETAYKTGFDSAAYFSKCFKDFYRISPNEFE